MGVQGSKTLQSSQSWRFSGPSPLRAALEAGDAVCFLALSETEAPLFPPLEEDQTPLHYAVKHGHYALAKAILRAPNLFPTVKNARDLHGQTALHLAVHQGSPELVALLMKYNCSPTLPDLSGQTPQDLALTCHTPFAIDIIEQVTAVDVMQKSPQSTRARTHSSSRPQSSGSSPLPNEPHSKGGSSHGSKSTLQTQAAEPQPGDLDVVAGEELDLEAEVRSSCIPLIPGSELSFGEVISRGSSCEVFKGKWRGCEVAIKQFHDEYKENQKELSKFVKEMQTLAQVRHPNLILLMGICLDLPHLCLIAEFVPNMSLFSALHSTGHVENKTHKLSLQERFRIAVQVCKGLAYLHACDPPIVHRDLKPENCLLDFDLNVKIADFGLARPLTCFSNEEALTTTCIGTTRFMAPELFERERSTSIGLEVDIWALGCVLIELFSGKRPWDYISSSEASCIFYEIFKRKPVPIPENMPSEVRELTERCCQYQPQRRPSATEVLQQLELASLRYLSVA